MGPFSWESLWHVGVVLLGIAIAYGAFRYLTRNRAMDPVTEEATRQEYDQEDRASHEVDHDVPRSNPR